MPVKNSLKQFELGGFYHVYSRGVNKRTIFIDEQDYRVFMGLFSRHLSKEEQKDKYYRVYESYRSRIDLLAYCQMPNHFHLLFYLKNDLKAVPELMRKVLGSYTNYFNKKYDRVGHLFQGVYKAKRIDDDAYLQHISRYIHLNPGDYMAWEFSSYKYYVGEPVPDWLKPDRILEIFNNDVWAYAGFMKDYEENKKILEEIKHQLADN